MPCWWVVPAPLRFWTFFPFSRACLLLLLDSDNPASFLHQHHQHQHLSAIQHLQHRRHNHSLISTCIYHRIPSLRSISYPRITLFRNIPDITFNDANMDLLKRGLNEEVDSKYRIHHVISSGTSSAFHVAFGKEDNKVSIHSSIIGFGDED